MNGFVKEARERIDRVNKLDSEKVEMKKSDFDKLVNNIGRERHICPGREECPEFPICIECWRDALLNYIRVI